MGTTTVLQFDTLANAMTCNPCTCYRISCFNCEQEIDIKLERYESQPERCPECRSGCVMVLFTCPGYTTEKLPVHKVRLPTFADQICPAARRAQVRKSKGKRPGRPRKRKGEPYDGFDDLPANDRDLEFD